MIESFIRDAHKAMDRLEQHQATGIREEGALQSFTTIIHGLKSSLWNIGETMLSELAYKLESLGREGDSEQVKVYLPGFLKGLRALLEKLELNRGELKTDKDIEDIQSRLLAIKGMCADYNRKGALGILSEIKKYSKETKAVLDRIMDNILQSNFKEAENAAAEYASDLSKAGSESSGGEPHELPAATPSVPAEGSGTNAQTSAGNIAGGQLFLNKEIAGLDITKGLEQFNGEEKTYLKLLRSYASSVGSMLDAIETVNEDKINDYKIKVHGIKGTSLDIFAEQVGKDARDLEEAAKAGNIGFINNNNPTFLKTARKLVSDIWDLISKLDAENPKPKKDKPDNEALSILLTACKNYEIDGIDAAMAEIEKYQYESDGGLADWLRECIDKMDLSKIVQKLSDLSK